MKTAYSVLLTILNQNQSLNGKIGMCKLYKHLQQKLFYLQMPVSDFIWSVEAPQLHNGGMKRKISGDACSVESQVFCRLIFIHVCVFMLKHVGQF